MLVSVHICVAVGALGTDGVLLGLGLTGLTSDDPDLIQAVYLTMDVIVPAVLFPLAVTALVSGVVLGLVTGHGIVRHYWVITKLTLTIGLVTLAAANLRPGVHEAASTARTLSPAELSAAEIGAFAVRAVAASTIGVLLLSIAVMLAVYKPWGRIRFRGR